MKNNCSQAIVKYTVNRGKVGEKKSPMMETFNCCGQKGVRCDVYFLFSFFRRQQQRMFFHNSLFFNDQLGLSESSTINQPGSSSTRMIPRLSLGTVQAQEQQKTPLSTARSTFRSELCSAHSVRAFVHGGVWKSNSLFADQKMLAQAFPFGPQRGLTEEILAKALQLGFECTDRSYQQTVEDACPSLSAKERAVTRPVSAASGTASQSGSARLHPSARTTARHLEQQQTEHASTRGDRLRTCVSRSIVSVSDHPVSLSRLVPEQVLSSKVLPVTRLPDFEANTRALQARLNDQWGTVAHLELNRQTDTIRITFDLSRSSPVMIETFMAAFPHTPGPQ
jgi:hypothetical protein